MRLYKSQKESWTLLIHSGTQYTFLIHQGEMGEREAIGPKQDQNPAGQTLNPFLPYVTPRASGGKI